MAGTEETQENQNTHDTSASVVDDDRRAWVEARGFVDDSVRELVLSDLHSRVGTARSWRAQGMVEHEPLETVRDACREFLSATEEEAAKLAGTPWEPPVAPCADCRGTDMHKPTCQQLRR